MKHSRLSRQEQRLHTRNEIRAAAVVVFSRQGFDATSVEDIAMEAGYTKGAIYSNFTSKEGLFLSLLDEHLARELQNVMVRGIDIATHQHKEEAELNRSFRDDLAEHRTWNLLTLEFILYALRHPTVQQRLAERYRRARQELAERFQAVNQRDGEEMSSNTVYIGWALIALGMGLAVQGYLEPEGIPTDLYREIIRHLVTVPKEGRKIPQHDS